MLQVTLNLDLWTDCFGTPPAWLRELASDLYASFQVPWQASCRLCGQLATSQGSSLGAQGSHRWRVNCKSMPLLRGMPPNTLQRLGINCPKWMLLELYSVLVVLFAFNYSSSASSVSDIDSDRLSLIDSDEWMNHELWILMWMNQMNNVT